MWLGSQTRIPSAFSCCQLFITLCNKSKLHYFLLFEIGDWMEIANWQNFTLTVLWGFNIFGFCKFFFSFCTSAPCCKETNPLPKSQVFHSNLIRIWGIDKMMTLLNINLDFHETCVNICIIKLAYPYFLKSLLKNLITLTCISYMTVRDNLKKLTFFGWQM